MRRRIIKSPLKQGTLTRRQIREAIVAAGNKSLPLRVLDWWERGQIGQSDKQSGKYIKIGRVGKMEVKIDIEVEKVDNGFILHRDIYGIKLQAPGLEGGREVYVTFPEVRARIIKLLQTIADELAEVITEKE